MTMISAGRERGLSEIVGFILILAAIVIAFALYATFGIPAVGREGEIAHMNEVRDRFVEYKVNIDSLWSNRQCGTAIGTSFTLGAGGAATTGSFSILPILSPAKSSGTLALSQRPEYIKITGDSLQLVNSPSQSWNESGQIAVSPGTLITFNTTPKYFFINISCRDLVTNRGVHVVPGYGSAWEAWVNITPVYSYSRRFWVTNTSPAVITGFGEVDETRWNHTDVTITTWNDGIQLMQDFIVYRNISGSPQTFYYVDLMNPSYGISTNLGKTQYTVATRSDSIVNATYLTNYSYWPTPLTQNWKMGSLEYRSTNEYWIPQTYYYQMGGVFLEQNEGITAKVPPAITISMSNGVPVVRLNQILLYPGTGIVEGAGTVQVTSSIDSIYDTPLIPGNNTRFVNISVQTMSENASQMWLQAFQNAASKGGLPVAKYKNGTAGLEAFINITSDPALYGVRFSMNRVVVNSAIQSAAPSAGG